MRIGRWCSHANYGAWVKGRVLCLDCLQWVAPKVTMDLPPPRQTQPRKPDALVVRQPTGIERTRAAWPECGTGRVQ